MSENQQQTHKSTPEEDIRVLFSRTAKLNDAVSALLAPAWGSEIGIIPSDHPLYVGEKPAATEGDVAPPESLSAPSSVPQTSGGELAGRDGDRSAQAASGGPGRTQLEARAFNAIQPALRAAGEWLPLSARRAVANAVLAELQPELDALARVRVLIDEDPVAVGTHLLEEALDQTATQSTEAVVTVHGARDLNPAAREAIDALIDVAKKQITEEQP